MCSWKIIFIPRKAFALLNTISFCGKHNSPQVTHVASQLKLSFLFILYKKCAIKTSFQMTIIPSTDGIEVWLLWNWPLLYSDGTNFTTQSTYTIQNIQIYYKFNNIFTLYFQVFPPSCLQLAWSINTLHTSLLPTQSPNSKHSHTCYCRTAHKWCTTGIVFSSILKEKHTAFVFQLGASSLLTITVKLLKEFLRFIFFLLQGSTMKSHTKITFTSVCLLWNAKAQGNFSTKKTHMVKRDLILVLQYHNSNCVKPQV